MHSPTISLVTPAAMHEAFAVLVWSGYSISGGGLSDGNESVRQKFAHSLSLLGYDFDHFSVSL